MLRRAAAVTVMSVALLAAGAVPALADGGWGNVDCSQNPYPGCELGAGEGGKKDVPGHQDSETPSQPGGGGSGSGGSGETRWRDPNLATCAYQRSDYKPPPEVVSAAYHEPAAGREPRAVPVVFVHRLGPAAAEQVDDPKPGEKGAWYVYKCTSDGVRDAFYRPPVWIPDGQPGGGGAAPAPSPAQIAQQARDQLRLPSPEIETNPPGEQLVNLPTWLWLARGNWQRVSATAAVPGVSVTAVARPTKVVWKLGDGSSVTCEGPGTPYDSDPRGKGAAQATSSSPDCGHTYRSSSAGQPADAYAVSATVYWTVTWAGAGQTGAFPGMTTTSNAQVQVAESQALNTGN